MYVRDYQDFLPILGSRVRNDGQSELAALAGQWNLELPAGFIQLTAAYGDAMYSGYLRIYGPRTLGFVGSFYGSVTDWDSDDLFGETDLLPEPGGILLWGDTVEGDMLCLENNLGDWRVAVSSKCIGSWKRYNLDFSDWLYGALRGDIATDWLPEWNTLPHSVSIFGPNPFGSTTLGEGPAGSFDL
jgi:hypothetical protein